MAALAHAPCLLLANPHTTPLLRVNAKLLNESAKWRSETVTRLGVNAPFKLNLTTLYSRVNSVKTNETELNNYTQMKCISLLILLFNISI